MPARPLGVPARIREVLGASALALHALARLVHERTGGEIAPETVIESAWRMYDRGQLHCHWPRGMISVDVEPLFSVREDVDRRCFLCDQPGHAREFPG